MNSRRNPPLLRSLGRFPRCSLEAWRHPFGRGQPLAHTPPFAQSRMMRGGGFGRRTTRKPPPPRIISPGDLLGMETDGRPPPRVHRLTLLSAACPVTRMLLVSGAGAGH